MYLFKIQILLSVIYVPYQYFCLSWGLGELKGIYTYCIINTRIYVFFVLLLFKVLSSKLLIIAFNCCQQAAPTTKIILHIKEVFFLRPLHFIFISYWKFSGIIWSCPFFKNNLSNWRHIWNHSLFCFLSIKFLNKCLLYKNSFNL